MKPAALLILLFLSCPACLMADNAALAARALRAGKAAMARFTIDPRMMSVVDRDGRRHIVPGAYRLWIGGGQPGSAAGQWTDFAVTGADMELPK